MEQILQKNDYNDIDTLKKMAENLEIVYEKCFSSSQETKRKNQEKAILIHDLEDDIYCRLLSSREKAESVIIYLSITINWLGSQKSRLFYQRIAQKMEEQYFIMYPNFPSTNAIRYLKEDLLVAYFTEKSKLLKKEKTSELVQIMIKNKSMATFMLCNQMKPIPLENLNDNLAFYFNFSNKSPWIIGYYDEDNALNFANAGVYLQQLLKTEDKIELESQKQEINLTASIFMTTPDKTEEFIKALFLQMIISENRKEKKQLQNLMRTLNNYYNNYKSTLGDYSFSRKKMSNNDKE